MGKLHELLAATNDVEKVEDKMLLETKKSFGKDHLFSGWTKTFHPYNPETAKANGLEIQPEEMQLTTTVMDRINYTFQYIIKNVDAQAQKDLTNQLANADIILPDGTVLAESVPVTTLLTLENRIKKWREVFQEAPTLDSKLRWKVDETTGNGDVFITEKEEVNYKTQKTIRHKVLYEATDKHPAQVEKWYEDLPVGEYRITHWSGKITSKKLMEILSRLDILLEAVKTARQRANDIEVVKKNIGKTVADFVLGK